MAMLLKADSEDCRVRGGVGRGTGGPPHFGYLMPSVSIWITSAGIGSAFICIGT
jgi:hypothetical protein